MVTAVILAGGFGTRLAEETQVVPKPLVEIGGMPIIWHILKIYAHNGVNEFIICLGYKGNLIKKFFNDYAILNSDICIDLAKDETRILRSRSEDWKVTLIDTGQDTMTGGRLKRIGDHLSIGEPFCMTYGDGVGDIDIAGAIEFHRSHGKLATVTSVTPPGRFGVLDVAGDHVNGFREKIASDQYKINAGYFVLETGVLDFIEDSKSIWEKEPMAALAAQGEMKAWHHNGFWMPMDTLRDKEALNQLWASGTAAWKVW